MSKAGAGVAAPMGFTFDPEKSVTANASAAWEVELANRRAQAERTAKVAARRVFRSDEIEFTYETFAPQTPTFVIDDERVAFISGEFRLIEFCGECGQDWRLYGFSSLATFGSALQSRDDEPDAFLCRECQWKGQLSSLGRKAA